jgi:hypothetical protein
MIVLRRVNPGRSLSIHEANSWLSLSCDGSSAAPKFIRGTDEQREYVFEVIVPDGGLKLCSKV